MVELDWCTCCSVLGLGVSFLDTLDGGFVLVVCRDNFSKGQLVYGNRLWGES